MLDASFVKSIDDLAVKASKPVFTQVPGDDRKFLVCRPDGSSEYLDVEKPLVAKMDRVESVFAIVAEWRKTEHLEPRLFLSPEKLVGVGEHDDRRIRAVCELKLTHHAAELKNPKPYTQDQLIDLMRFYFTERIDKTVIDRVKAIRFKKTEEGAAVTGHQSANASISREVQIQSMVGGGEIPDTIPVMVKPFICFDFEATVTCGLLIDLEQKKFRLMPIAEELDELFVAALDKIAELRTGEHPPLYFGKVNTGRSNDDES